MFSSQFDNNLASVPWTVMPLKPQALNPVEVYFFVPIFILICNLFIYEIVFVFFSFYYICNHENNVSTGYHSGLCGNS